MLSIDDHFIERLRSLFEVRGRDVVYRRGVSTKNTRRKPGDIAGTINPKGYRVICVEKQLIRAHQIAFAITHGRWPISQLDHIDRDKQNNSPDNLREVDNRTNAHNRGNNAGAGKPPGVYRHSGRWRACIEVSGINFHLGVYNSIDAASRAYQVALALVPCLNGKQHAEIRKAFASALGLRVRPSRWRHRNQTSSTGASA